MNTVKLCVLFLSTILLYKFLETQQITYWYMMMWLFFNTIILLLKEKT